MSERTKFLLGEERIPRTWYNIVADLPQPPAAVLHQRHQRKDRERTASEDPVLAGDERVE